MKLSTGKILEDNLDQSAVHQTLGDEFTYMSLKRKAKSTLELLNKTTLNVPEWPSYSFDLSSCLAMINDQLDQSLNNFLKNNAQILYNPGVQSS